MAAPFLDLASKMEAAVKSVVDALALVDADAASVPCFTGLDDDSNATPCVTVRAEVGEEVVPDTGNDRVTVSIQVITRAGGNKGETLAQHRARVATVFDALRDNELSVTLSAAVSDFYVFDIWKSGESESTTSTSLISELNLEAVACAKDLAAA